MRRRGHSAGSRWIFFLQRERLVADPHCPARWKLSFPEPLILGGKPFTFISSCVFPLSNSFYRKGSCPLFYVALFLLLVGTHFCRSPGSLGRDVYLGSLLDWSLESGKLFSLLRRRIRCHVTSWWFWRSCSRSIRISRCWCCCWSSSFTTCCYRKCSISSPVHSISLSSCYLQQQWNTFRAYHGLQQ